MEIELNIKQQGAPVVNFAAARYQSDKCVVVELDLRSKYCEIMASAGHALIIGATPASLHLHDTASRDELTLVEFKLPPGTWTYACGNLGRYTLTACYLKED